jgi:diguanylate cyclase (GGDEF)-like protein
MTWRNDGIDRQRKSFFLWAVAATAAVILAELGTALFEGGVSRIWPVYVALNVVGFSVSPLIPILLIYVFGGTKLRYAPVLLLPCILTAVLAILSPAFGWIFTVSAEGVYHRGSLYNVYVAAYGWGMLVLLTAILKTGRRYGYRFHFKLQAMLLFVALGTTIQLLLPQVHTAWTCVTMALALHYGFVCEYNDTHDALTGLCNRKSYERELARLRRVKRFAIVAMDVDGFKIVNDRYGHPYGDQCLAKLAALTREAFSKIGVCYRIGGDEFCILCRNADEARIRDALMFLMRMIDAARAEDASLPVLSYGCRHFDAARGGTIAETIEAADREMYQIKAQRKRENGGLRQDGHAGSQNTVA